MKCETIRDSKRLVRVYDHAGRLCLRIDVQKAGTVIDHPDAWKLVLQGKAVPADEECKRKVPFTPSQMQAAINAGEKLSRKIAPDDYDAYDRGLMVGYKPDGSDGDTWKPGPNWVPGCEAEYYSDNEEDDDDE